MRNECCFYFPKVIFSLDTTCVVCIALSENPVVVLCFTSLLSRRLTVLLVSNITNKYRLLYWLLLLIRHPFVNLQATDFEWIYQPCSQLTYTVCVILYIWCFCWQETTFSPYSPTFRIHLPAQSHFQPITLLHLKRPLNDVWESRRILASREQFIKPSLLQTSNCLWSALGGAARSNWFYFIGNIKKPPATGW